MRRDFTKVEDLQPGVSFKPQQPEATARGLLWTQRVVLDWPTPSWCWMTIREHDGVIEVDHGKVYPIADDEDGA